MNSDMLNFTTRWFQFAKPEHAFWTHDMMVGLYGGGGITAKRPYHNIHHIKACLDFLDSVTTPRVDKQIAELALWWHDAIYVPGAPNNEKLSAELLTGLRGCLAVDLAVLRWACRCIEATKHAETEMLSGNPTVDVVVDIDLSILGAESDDYGLYVECVRREFSFVDDPAWAKGRGAFLAGMLAKPRVFLTDEFQDRFGATAVANMTAEAASIR